MLESMRHRGPDDEGEYFFPGCALGHVRLSIVDIASGAQPMLSSTGRRAITFNGEIYGYQELRKGFDQYPFRTVSDTEVILAGYEALGDRFLDRLPGMFAFALWNEDGRRLVCARDRFGEKPLFYAFGPDGEFVFASEIKAILASGLVQPRISLVSLAHYLQRLYVPANATIYENVHSLPPAHRLTLANGEMSTERYWSFPAETSVLAPREAAGTFLTLLDRAVQRQLVADVPVCAFLSGGLDSSSIVTVASAHSPRLRTLAFGFRDGFSELPFARAVADRVGSDHVELTDDGIDLAELLTAMARVYDEPFADSSNIPTYLMCRLARRYAKVVLSGDGGDEMLGGYAGWYRRLHRMQALAHLPVLLSTVLGLGHALSRRIRGWSEAAYCLRKFGTPGDAHARAIKYFPDDQLPALLRPIWRDGTELNCGYEGLSSLSEIMRQDTADYMPGDILTKVDRASMAHGLEVRAPFLDVDLASFCLSLPSRLKVTGDTDKLILRLALQDRWPPSVRARKKQGFGAPVHKWLRAPSLQRLKREHLLNQSHPVFALISFEATRRLVERDDYATWILLVLAIWVRGNQRLLSL